MTGNQKIRSFDDLVEVIKKFRSEKDPKKIVHCHGVFDLLHIGHIRYLQQAKKLGDILVVTLTQDKHVNKGPHRPAFTENLRAEALAALDCVDFVAVNQWATAVETMKFLQPDIYAKGAEYKTNRTEEILSEEAEIKEMGGKIVFIDDITSSSSHLVNKHLDLFPEEVRTYLEGFSRRYEVDDVLKCLEDVRPLRVLTIGETIIDEYQYCESIGKSSKDSALAARYLSTELFAGGILAVSNHIANFSNHVGLLTLLGAEDSREDFIRQHLNPEIEKIFFYKEDAPTIVKRRFIDHYLLSKFFEIYVIEDRELNEAENRILCEQLNECVAEYDVVIVADFGHSMLTEDAIEIICKKARFLAVNTQVNAGNRGFNTISKYPRADYISLNETEIRLETRNRQGALKDIVLDLSQKLACKRILVTRGKYGNLCYDKDEGLFETPAFATRVVDRIGAGDAVLSITSLCTAINVPAEVVSFIANVIGAEAAAIVGNRSSIEKAPLFRHIISLLK